MPPPPPPINQTIHMDDIMRILVLPLGRGAPNPLNPHANRDNPSWKRPITIIKLLTKFLGEGDPISHME